MADDSAFDVPFGSGEMSLLVRHDEVPPSGKTIHHQADEAVLTALGERFGVDAVADLRFEALITPLAGDCLQATGEVSGRVQQPCGVTLEPVWTDIRQPFSLEFQPAEMVAQYVIPEDDFDSELPEAMHQGDADIGEAVTQIFAMEVPAYPRAPDAAFEGYGQSEAEIAAEDKKPSPFAALAALKDTGDET